MSNEQKLREALQAVIAAHDACMRELGEQMRTANLTNIRIEGQAVIDAFATIEQARQALATTDPDPTGMPELPEPDSYEFQHEETGNTMFVDRQQVEWGFEKNNPRLQKIAGAYTTSQMRAYGEQCWKAGYKHGINN